MTTLQPKLSAAMAKIKAARFLIGRDNRQTEENHRLAESAIPIFPN
jgi:hypothetical protein